MFWNIVSNGFKILLEWQVWLVVFVYSGVMYFNHKRFINRAFMASVYGEETRSDTYRRMDSFAVLKSIIDSILVVSAVFLLLPILLGTDQFSSFSDLRLAFKTIVIIILIVTGARIILSKLSGPDKFSFTASGTHVTYFVCVFLISFIMHKIIGELPIPDRSGVFPSFWWCLGFVGISFILILVGAFGVGLIVSVLNEQSKNYVTNSINNGAALLSAIIYMRMYCYFIIERVSEVNIKWDAI